MADSDNKLMAGGTFGDSDWNSGLLGMDNDPDFATDGAGIPSGGPSNKFDGAGDPGVSNKTDMTLSLTPNQFPRQKGHDSLTEDEATLS